MGNTHGHSREVRSLDTMVGDDGDTPGIAQELTADDIDDVAFSPDLSVGERVERLMELRDELLMRRAGDLNGDMNETLSHIRDRLRILKSDTFEGDAALESAGMDTTDRMDDDDPSDFVGEADQEAVDDIERRNH
jgi:hypothetical protein